MHTAHCSRNKVGIKTLWIAISATLISLERYHYCTCYKELLKELLPCGGLLNEDLLKGRNLRKDVPTDVRTDVCKNVCTDVSTDTHTDVPTDVRTTFLRLELSTSPLVRFASSR